MGAKNSNQLKSTLPNSEEEESAHFLSAGTHPISNKSDRNSCYLRQSQNLHPTRYEKEFGDKNSENVWQKSKQTLGERNQENLNDGFQGNKGNAESQNCNRWINNDNDENEEEGNVDEEEVDLPFQVCRKLPLQVDKEFLLQASPKLPVQALDDLPIQFQVGKKERMKVEGGKPVQFQRKVSWHGWTGAAT